LVIYTDGITEAENPDADEYGIERLQQICLEHREKSLKDLAEKIETDLDEFSSGVPYADDRTYVLVRRN
jgi:sigma-B regulation protein RsbU (phosphoserine phosphatase)